MTLAGPYRWSDDNICHNVIAERVRGIPYSV